MRKKRRKRKEHATRYAPAAMHKMPSTITSLLCVATAAFLCTCMGCSPQSTDDTPGDAISPEASQIIEPVEVVRGQLVPTASSTSVVLVSQSFAITAPLHGMFYGAVADGDYVAAGDTLGTVGGEPLLAPVDGVVESPVPDNDVAAGYPLMFLRYGGMSSQVDVSALLRTADSPIELSGRFHVSDGQGPTDCAAVVPVGGGTMASAASADESYDGETVSGTSNETMMQCLFPKDTVASAGQSVVTVLTAPAVEDALLLPVTAVAGRAGSGQVLLKKGDNYTVADVSLGASDGTSIVILDGLSEGDQVSSVAPNLMTEEETS